MKVSCLRWRFEGCRQDRNTLHDSEGFGLIGLDRIVIDLGSTVLALLDLLHSLVLGTPWGEARIIVIFTTNNKDMLDPTLLSRISVDIYMGHCCFEGFKVLASNYWASLMTMMMSHTVSIQTSSV
ncbi:hypothetical protein F2Q69_00021562 [Brassica cretica]|uniref:ATPase AAA-type core domain-containing protein n=1 Tax=Brassica cretica TaxID=69181 RepID=A0A8S9Q3X6_BRACR|nr:hypothetical protein F2Q69_00021562 [Brassica cretica]